MAPLQTRLLQLAAALSLGLSLLPSLAQEVQYPSDQFAKLDTFEAVAVEDADKLFNKQDYPGAYAAYKAYSIEFAQGRALPYVLLRMGRCLHLAGKRNTAVKAYQDVVDYFPNDVRYAAAAMYHIGQCHLQNGNDDKALAVWAKMVKDKAYVGEANSGSALIALAEAMQKRGDYEEAATYQWRTAVAFRQSNRRAADDARNSVIHHYVVRSPNQEKLLAFCDEVGGFGWHGRIDKPEDSPRYWSHVLNTALNAKLDDAKRIEVCRYWDSQMGDRFADNDDVRVAWFNARLAHDKDAKAWAKRMDEQFKREPVTIQRVKQWLAYFGRYPETRSAFFAKHGKPLVGSLDTGQQLDLIRHLRAGHLRMHDEAAEVLLKVSTNGMEDPALREYANYVADYQGEQAFLRAVGKMKDATAAAEARFDWYYARSRHNAENQKKALAEIPALKNATDDAQDIVWKHATLMQWQGEYEQAIKLYRKANREPQSSWAVISCYEAMKQYDKAVQLCKELESVGGDTASAACLRAAEIYRAAGDKGKEVQQLQLVLRRYPKSGQSSTAHGRLESYGVKIIGGESEARD